MLVTSSKYRSSAMAYLLDKWGRAITNHWQDAVQARKIYIIFIEFTKYRTYGTILVTHKELLL